MDRLPKKALMIAPSYYELPENLWLTGTERDIEAMKKVLKEKCDFEDREIRVLQGDEATKINILKVLDDFTRSCEERSVLLVYYSGHGVYLQDSHDEGIFPTIRKDEWPITRPKEEVCITGSDLCPFFDKLSRRAVRCTVIFDCCHSGQLYRVTDFNETNLKPRQIILRDEPAQSTRKLRRYFSVSDRGGWTPSEKDFFFYFAACTTVQVALEEINKGGRMTMAIIETLNKLECLDEVTYDAFFRLLNKEFKDKGWDNWQTPQFEAVNSHTVLFGVRKITTQEGGIEITDVLNENEVVVSSGYLQNLRAGRYNVFRTTASKDSVNKGDDSKDWLGHIVINEEQIDTTQAVGYISYLRRECEMTVGCLAYIDEPETVNNSVYVCPEPGLIPEEKVKFLIEHLKSTQMLNVSRAKPTIPNADLITISCEHVKGYASWVARRRGKVLTPAITAGAGRESVVANNLLRHIRYNLLMDAAKPPDDNEDLLENVSLKFLKVENVQAYTKHTKKARIREALNTGIDITNVTDRRIIFKAHEFDEKGKIKFGTGDCFLFQVSNDNERKEDTIHICVMLYQFDGAVKAIYPKKYGKTIELRGCDTAEDLFPVVIPKYSLRTMLEPDLDKDEPNMGVDTLVLYASNKAVDYRPIEQSCIRTDPELLPRGRGEAWHPLSNLDDFLMLRKRPVPDNELEQDCKYFIQRIDIPISKTWTT